MAGLCVNPRPNAVVSFYGYGDIAGTWYSRPDPYYCQQSAVSRKDAYASVGDKPISNELGSGNRWRFYLYCRQQGLWPKEVTGHDPDTEVTAFDPFCPIRNITSLYPPTLLLHGDQDTDVSYNQSKIMADELRHGGVPHELITISGGGHRFDNVGLKDPIVADAFQRVVAFLKSNTQ